MINFIAGIILFLIQAAAWAVIDLLLGAFFYVAYWFINEVIDAVKRAHNNKNKWISQHSR